MKKVVQYKKTSLLKRACVFFLDFVVAVLCFVFVNAMIVNPIVDATTDYDETYESYYGELLDSHLYYEDENGFIQIIAGEYDKNLILFFESINELDTYNKMKEESGYFEYNAETNTWDKSQDAIDSDVKQFYLNTLLIARDDYLLSRESIKEKELLLNGYNTLMLSISAVVGILVAFFLVPVFSKDGSTVGMKPFYYQVVKKDDGSDPSRMQVLIRYLIVFVLYGLSSMYTLGLPLIVSGLMTIFTERHVSLVDFLTSTYVVDCGELEDKVNRFDLKATKIDYLEIK